VWAAISHARRQAEDLLLGDAQSCVTLTFLRPTSPSAPATAPLLEYSVVVRRTHLPVGRVGADVPAEGGGPVMQAPPSGAAQQDGARVVRYQTLMEAQTCSTLYPAAERPPWSAVLPSSEPTPCSPQAPHVSLQGTGSADAVLDTHPRPKGRDGRDGSEVRVEEAASATEDDTTDVLWMLEQVMYRLRAAARGRPEDAGGCGVGVGEEKVLGERPAGRKARRKVKKSTREQEREESAWLNAASRGAARRKEAGCHGQEALTEQRKVARDAALPYAILRVGTKVGGKKVAIGAVGVGSMGAAECRRDVKQADKRKVAGSRSASSADTGVGRGGHVGEGQRGGGMMAKPKKSWVVGKAGARPKFAWR